MLWHGRKDKFLKNVKASFQITEETGLSLTYGLYITVMITLVTLYTACE